MAMFAVKLGTYSLGSQAAVNAISITSNKRISEFPIIRENAVVVPDGKMNALKITLSGTLMGTGYTNFRDELAKLRRAAENGKQSFYLDNERFARIVSRSFDYAFVKQDFCNFNINLACELPDFLAETVSSDVRSVTTGSYSVTNAGDSTVPVEVIINAVLAGTLANAQIENATLAETAVFTGSLTSTQPLIIDNGYLNYNVPQYTVTVQGVNAMSAFQGDFLHLGEGANIIRYTGAVAATISLYWRQAYKS